MSVKLQFLFIGLVLCLCISCDKPWLPSLRQNNFGFVENANDPLIIAVDGYYYYEGTKYWVILYKKINPIPTGTPFDVITLLCFHEITVSSSTTYEFEAGLYVQTYPTLQYWTPTTIDGYDILKKDGFFAKRVGQSMNLVYDGRVIGSDGRKYWLRFNVKAKENGQKVVSIYSKLHAVLKQEVKAEDVVKCFSPLLDEQSK